MGPAGGVKAVLLNVCVPFVACGPVVSIEDEMPEDAVALGCIVETVILLGTAQTR